MMATTQLRKRYKKPTNMIRRWAFEFTISTAFDNFMIVVIMANVLSMFFTHEGESARQVFRHLPPRIAIPMTGHHGMQYQS